jgi:hypothetical protein
MSATAVNIGLLVSSFKQEFGSAFMDYQLAQPELADNLLVEVINMIAKGIHSLNSDAQRWVCAYNRATESVTS